MIFSTINLQPQKVRRIAKSELEESANECYIF